MKDEARQLAFLALRAVQQGAFADVALDRVLRDSPLKTNSKKTNSKKTNPKKTSLSGRDRRLVTELVYGSIRRQRTLDALIDQLAKKKSHQHPPELRLILRLGLYQLRYLSHIPASAAVDTAVELAKHNGFKGLAGFVNGLLRQYGRLTGRSAIGQSATAASHEPQPSKIDETVEIDGKIAETDEIDNSSGMQSPPKLDPLQLPADSASRLAIQHSYPDWIVAIWLTQFGLEETEKLCDWFNQSPHIDLRINPLQASIEQVETALQTAGIAASRISPLPQALRLPQGIGAIQSLPGFAEGWWTVQDSSAQLVSHLLEPQPGEIIIDACAAPGGKTTHLAELMQDQGMIWGCDRHASRLKKLQENAARLQLQSIQIRVGDSRQFPQFVNQADRVLLDAPCSGLGTLHRHADARWRQTPETVKDLAQLQTELLNQSATWVKPGGILVYATCTLHPAENEAVIKAFLNDHPDWQIEPPAPNSPAAAFVAPPGWLKVLPHHHQMDGFFMVRLRSPLQSSL